MTKNLRIVMAQLNFLVGDIQGNLLKHIQAAIKARDTFKADVIVFPELSLSGYPPEDLPNYGVFDEKRYFAAGDSPSVVNIRDIEVGVIICEDLWYATPTQQAATKGARIILSPNASPFEIDKDLQRQRILAKRAKADNIPIVYVNQVGGQDDLIFDGGSMVVDAEGNVCQRANFFVEELVPVDIEITATEAKVKATTITLPSEEEIIYQALVLSLRDYVRKNNFPGVLLGVSGGIDSALVLAIAVDAVGKDHVSAVCMPSRYTADISMEDADRLINNLGVKHETISIEPVFKSFLSILAPVFGKMKPDITEENLQSRCRGMILMAMSNKSGRMVLSTGNRSEMAVGYTTLYGDMAGGYAVLKDVPKTLVYRLADYRNKVSPVIPQRIIDRPPTAELAPDQTDQDTLPPYDVLDEILLLYLNLEQSVEQIVAQGFARDMVEKVVKMVKRNEYKRRQSPLGGRINHTAFGRDRRYPVTSGFKK
jgi:NAD+ synthase (glutamine-hydrolysing)